ncbi:MAG TPA: two-component regulator propeller domain-containing protein [Thermoanaerobaculia bacterium]|nr:two-component regulator propeller domain-containing protein [Thermoanaerobaculia bacterium]
MTDSPAGARAARWSALACLVLLWLSAAVAAALDRDLEMTHYGHDVWDSDAGLPQNSVQVILQSRDGYFWLGTQEGLARFDGVRFTVYDSRNTPALKDDWIQALCETRDGTLWIGTLTGLARRRNGAFEAIGEGTGLERAFVGALLEARDGTLWIGSSEGLARIRGDKVELLGERDGFPRERIRALYEDESGGLWFGLPMGLGHLFGGNLEIQKFQSDFPGTPLSVIGDGQGGLWVGTPRGLVHTGSGGARLFTEKDGLDNTLARALCRDRQGAIWIGTGNGLYRFHKGAFTRYSTVNGLSSDRVLSIYEDGSGSLWVGTVDGGLNRLKSQRVVNYTRREGLSDDKIWTVFEDRGGTLWVGTADGNLDRMRPGNSTFEHVTRVGATVLAVVEDSRGDLWIATQGAGLVRYRQGQLTHFGMAQGLPGNWITSLCVDREGALWIGTLSNGLARFLDGNLQTFHVADGLPNEQVFSIYEDREGDLWIGTFGGGVARRHDGLFTTLSTKDGLAHDIVISSYQDSEGTLWFATRGGLSRYRDGKFTTYRQKEGLFHDAAQRVVEDGHGYLWMTSNRGIFRVLEAELAAVASGGDRIHPVAFNTASGMRSAECNNAQHGVWRSRDGRLWFATVKGLVMADPARIELNRVPPAVVIEEVLSGGEPVEARDGARLPPGTHDLEFRYTAFNYVNPTSVRFRYRLEGIDGRWVDAGSRRTAYYTHLPPGRYRFHVIACNEDGVWSTTGAALPVRLEPRFYQTGWFQALTLLGVLLAGVAFHRLRVRRIESREWFRSALAEAKLNALQAQLRPHFLANTLNSILTLIGSDSARARRMTERLGDLLRASLETDPGQVVTVERELSVLELYLGIERMRFRDQLEVLVEVDPVVREADVPSFLLQPLAENAIKHGMRGTSGRGVIQIRAAAQGGRLVLSVEDNGPGIAATDTGRPAGIGVRNTRQRLETLYPGRHRFELGKASSGGCLVTIEIPLTREAAKADTPSRVAPVSARLVPVPAGGDLESETRAERSVSSPSPLGRGQA